MSSRPVRWLVASTEYAGLTAYTGGIGRHYAALLPALAARGAHVDLALFSEDAAVHDEDHEGIRVIHVRTDRDVGHGAALRRATRLRDIHARGVYDRVFLPEWGGLGALLPSDAPLVTNLATSLRLANEISGVAMSDLPLENRAGAAEQMLLEDRQIRRSRGLVAISRAMRDRVAASMGGGLPATAVVGNCIEVGRARDLSRRSPVPEPWPGGADPVILFLGRAERRKGVEDAVSAFGRVHDEHPFARLVLAGAGGDQRYEPTRTALMGGLTPSARARVTWLGHVGGAALYAAIRAATVVMCPSRWEGFGLAALEAMAIGTPLVVTSGSGFDDFCEDGATCLTAPPCDAERLAHALGRVLAGPDAARARADAASTRAEEYAPAPIAASLDEVVGELLAGR